MFLNSFPNSAPLFSLSAFLMEFSLHKSNITSIFLELDPSCSTKLNRNSATSAKVLWSPLSLCTRAIASIIHADGCGITSRLRMEHIFVVLLPERPCLFFLTTHQQWITPRELLSFEAFGFLLLISSGRIDGFLSAFRMISFDALLLTCTLLFRSVNVCSFAFWIVSLNLV